MNFKSLFASIGVIISSLFSPVSAKANVIGDLTSNELLSPSFKIDSMLVSNYSNSSLLWANYPQTYDTLSLSSGQSSTSDPITNSFLISSMKQSGYTGITEPLRLAKIRDDVRLETNHYIYDLLYNNLNSPFGIGGNYGDNRFAAVDFDFVSNDLIIQKSDLFNVRFLIATVGTSTPVGTVHYNISFDLNSKTTEGDGDWIISQFHPSASGSFNFTEVDFNMFNIGARFYPFIYSFPLFSLFDDYLADEGDTLWISNFKLTISLTSGQVWAVGWEIPYYNPDTIVERGDFRRWLSENDLLAGGDDLCSQVCPVCPTCPTCPGTNIDVSYTDWLTTAIGGFFDFELFPGFSFGGVIAIVFILLFVIWVLKVIAGG